MTGATFEEDEAHIRNIASKSSRSTPDAFVFGAILAAMTAPQARR